LKKKPIPAYQAISQALELPFRFYNKTGNNDPLEAGYYYQTRDEILKGLSVNDRATWEKLHPSEKVENGLLNSQQKAMLYLNNPKIQLREMLLAQALKDKLGQEYDPVWDLPADKRNQIFAARTSLPGEKNTVKAELSKESWYDQFNKMKAAYYNRLGEKLGTTTPSEQPKPTSYVQGQMDVKNLKDPQVQEYLDSLTAYNNQKRTALGLSEIPPYGSSFSKYLKKPKTYAVKKITVPKFKKPKFAKPKSLKSILAKIKAPKKRKALSVVMPKKPKFAPVKL